MKKIGGNIEADVQIKTTVKNTIGESVETWNTVGSVLGWLDYHLGQSNVNVFNTKIQDTTHFFLCDYYRWVSSATAEDCRMVINGNVYNVLLIDDPMQMHEHLEIYLQYMGGGLGVE